MSTNVCATNHASDERPTAVGAESPEPGSPADARGPGEQRAERLEVVNRVLAALSADGTSEEIAAAFLQELESLAESEARYRSLVAHADEMILVFDALTHRLLDANRFTAQLLGYDVAELLTMRLDDLLEADELVIEADLPRLHEHGQIRSVERRYRRKDGMTVLLDIVASPLSTAAGNAVLVLGRDVSERQALQRQLVQSQKMESLGTMAGAVAHDFNNLLTTILGFTGLLKRSAALGGEDRENLTLIEDAARKAADLTGRLLSFARGGLVRFGTIDLREVVEDTVRLAQPAFPETVHMRVSLPDSPVSIEGDAGQVHQALLNIVLNARDAMLAGGDVEIALSADDSDATIVIRDSGPGMDEETRMRIFEPFYTTKTSGTGTGLGMAITYGIVQGHHGRIVVDSAPGAGTSFTVHFPLTDRTASAATVLPDPGDGNLVLVVDDDWMVRRATCAMLWDLGYAVAPSGGGELAVELVRARPDRFAAVILDLVMPGMTGSETFHALMALRPEIPVIVCTGFAADKHLDPGMTRQIAGLVRKPFTREQLGEALRTAGVQPVREARL